MKPQEFIKTELKENEEVQANVDIIAIDSGSSGVLFLTNQRLVFIKKKFGGKFLIKSIDLDKIISVNFKKGLVTATILVETKSKKTKFDAGKKDEVEDFYKKIIHSKAVDIDVEEEIKSVKAPSGAKKKTSILLKITYGIIGFFVLFFVLGLIFSDGEYKKEPFYKTATLDDYSDLSEGERMVVVTNYTTITVEQSKTNFISTYVLKKPLTYLPSDGFYYCMEEMLRSKSRDLNLNKVLDWCTVNFVTDTRGFDKVVFNMKIKKHFSGWDGSHRKLTRMIKDTINDPASYKQDKTTYKIFPKKGYYQVTTRFRAKNAFGAYIRAEVIADFNEAGDLLRVIKDIPQ